MGFVEVHHCLSLNDCCSRLSCRSLVTGICHLLAEAVSKRKIIYAGGNSQPIIA